MLTIYPIRSIKVFKCLWPPYSSMALKFSQKEFPYFPLFFPHFLLEMGPGGILSRKMGTPARTAPQNPYPHWGIFSLFFFCRTICFTTVNRVTRKTADSSAQIDAPPPPCRKWYLPNEENSFVNVLMGCCKCLWPAVIYNPHITSLVTTSPPSFSQH